MDKLDNFNIIDNTDPSVANNTDENNTVISNSTVESDAIPSNSTFNNTVESIDTNTNTNDNTIKNNDMPKHNFNQQNPINPQSANPNTYSNNQTQNSFQYQNSYYNPNPSFNNMQQPNNNYQQYITKPYLGGSPVTCPKCNNVNQNRYCFYCGLDLSKVYSVNVPLNAYNDGPTSYYYPKKKKSAGKTALIIIISVLLFIAIFVTSFVALSNIFQAEPNPSPKPGQQNDINSNSGFYHKGGFTQEELSKIKLDMSYAQVSQIIGGDGVLGQRGETLHGEKYFVCSWVFETNPNVVLHVTFTSGKVTDIQTDNL